MKKIIIERDGIVQLVLLSKSQVYDLRLHATWALKNMLYHADSQTKIKVILQLGWQFLEE
jgi:hypothetical protein